MAEVLLNNLKQYQNALLLRTVYEDFEHLHFKSFTEIKKVTVKG